MPRKSRSILSFFISITAGAFLLAAVALAQAKSAVLFIGDGMGPEQVKAASILLYGKPGKLAMQSLPFKGTLTNKPADDDVTDSAAAATALATGHKTNNGMISMSPDGTILKTILEAARDAGKATGIVATSTITHATPAGFSSHLKDREGEQEIAVQQVGNRINVILGGGLANFVPKEVKGSYRKDSRDLIAEAEKAGYNVIQKKEDLPAAQGPYLLGLFKMDCLETKDDEPSLADMTAKAIEILSADEDGFLLMVEGSQVDWACHGNNQDYFIRQMQELDAAVKAALDFASKRKDVLIVVTADHETGGLSCRKDRGKKIRLHWEKKTHTATNVPIFAWGAGAENFKGRHDNTDVPKFIASAMGMGNFPE